MMDEDDDGFINRKEYNSVFDFLDVGKRGFIERKDFEKASFTPFHLIDKDKDNRLTRQEYQDVFYLFDIDGDGCMDKDEFNGSVHPQFFFEMLDTDGDGKIDRKEYNAGFDLLDTNKDGFVTELEFIRREALEEGIRSRIRSFLSRPRWLHNQNRVPHSRARRLFV